MIYEVRTTDFKGKCGNCFYFETSNGIDGKCTSLETQIRPWNRFRSYNSKACVHKEVSSEKTRP